MIFIHLDQAVDAVVLLCLTGLGVVSVVGGFVSALLKGRAVTEVVFVRHIKDVFARPELLHWDALDFVVPPVEGLQPNGAAEFRNKHPQLLVIFCWHAGCK